MSGAREAHLRTLPKPYVNRVIHTDHSVQPLRKNGVALALPVLPLPVANATKPNHISASVQHHYSACNPTAGGSAAAPRIGTLALVLVGTCVSPFASGRQVPTFLAEAWRHFTPPTCRMPLGQSAGRPPSSSWPRLNEPVLTSSEVFRHFIGGSLSFVS